MWTFETRSNVQSNTKGKAGDAILYFSRFHLPRTCLSAQVSYWATPTCKARQSHES